MKRILSYLLLFTLTACIYPYTPDVAVKVDDTILVVSGELLAGQESLVTLSKVSPLGTTAYETVMNKVEGVVTLVGRKGGEVCMGTRTSNGQYALNMENLDPLDEYKLRVAYAGNVYETPFMGILPAPVITALDYTVNDENLNLRISLDGGDSLSDFLWNYNETWEYHAMFVPDLMYVPDQNTEDPSIIYRKPEPEEDYYYCWTSRDGAEPCLATTAGQSENRIKDLVFRSVPRSDPRVSVLYSISVTARGLSPDGRAYLEYLDRTSNITGDLFTPVPSNISGNMRCVTDTTRTVIGFMELSQSVFKRIFVSYAGVYDNIENPYYYLYYPSYDESAGLYHFDTLYWYGDAPVFLHSKSVPPVPTTDNVEWAPRRCTDCRVSGGTKNKPEWWPNQHK